MVIKSAESDQEYREVLETCIREVGEALGDTVPEFSNLRSFVFVSSPVRLRLFTLIPSPSFFSRLLVTSEYRFSTVKTAISSRQKQLRDHWHGGHRNQPFPAALADRGSGSICSQEPAMRCRAFTSLGEGNEFGIDLVLGHRADPCLGGLSSAIRSAVTA